MADGMQSAASPVPCRGSRQVLQKQPSGTGLADLIPKSWDGSHDNGQFRNFMAEPHLWVQAWSDQGERMLVRVEGVDKVDR